MYSLSIAGDSPPRAPGKDLQSQEESTIPQPTPGCHGGCRVKGCDPRPGPRGQSSWAPRKRRGGSKLRVQVQPVVQRLEADAENLRRLLLVSAALLERRQDELA